MTLTISRSVEVEPLAGAEAGERSPFAALDDVLGAPRARGVVMARVESLAHARAIAAHATRRARAAGREVVVASCAPVDSGIRDAAQRLGVEAAALGAGEVARAMAREASLRDATVVVPMVAVSVWDESACAALAEAPGRALFVLLVAAPDALGVAGVPCFDVDPTLDEAGLERFWSALIAERRGSRGGDLVSLDAWARALDGLEPGALRCAPTDPSSCRLLARLRLARRAWPSSRAAALGDASALAALIASGHVQSEQGLVVTMDAGGAAPDTDHAERRWVASALVTTFPSDPWAHARAAELEAEAGDELAAERMMGRAFTLAVEAGCRAELWRRWDAMVAASADADSLRLRGAELALSLGDVDVAIEWAHLAASAEPGARAAFVLGRAALARGDLVSAEAALRRASELAAGDDARLEAAMDLAEVRFAAGDLARAEELARSVRAGARVASVRLSAQNLLGKLLLARAAWDEADAHFAADSCDAALAGETIAELRARVNRAIALLSRGSLDEARPMLADVLADAEARGELRAVGFALSNLAVIAINRHDYGEALELSERAIAVRRRLGDRLGFARDVTNLVGLRLRLGLIEQAEQGLKFGRQALGAGAPAPRLAELSLASARAHLARGRTLDAERELRSALRTAGQASDGDKLAECHRLAVRVALDDGAVARARVELAHARELSSSPFAEGEVAVLTAAVERAAGEEASALAEHAVLQARLCGDEELCREAHVLAAEIALGAGDTGSAAQHLASATALRDEVCRGLERGLRETYLLRADLLRLARLERALGEEPVDSTEAPPSAPAPRSRPAGPAPAFAGRHPSVRALLASVQRVGRTGATVLVHGESGTGKELIAEAIHAASGRAAGPLVKVNCAALVESLLLSELFGHEKGAFTGAAARRRGRFERASGGTLFLDEIGDISPRTQVALLRVLEERTIERVGGSAAIPVDVRIVCATNRDLRALVERGSFREDLYYRLSGITLDVPPLRERIQDLPVLAEALLARVALERGERPMPLGADALALLARHRWPGNVRELDNALRAASLFAMGDVLTIVDFVEHVEALRALASRPPIESVDAEEPRATLPAAGVEPELGAGVEPPVVGTAYREIRQHGLSLGEVKRQIERDCIAQALSETAGNITRAALVLGMKRPRLSQLVKQYGLLPGVEEDGS